MKSIKKLTSIIVVAGCFSAICFMAGCSSGNTVSGATDSANQLAKQGNKTEGVVPADKMAELHQKAKGFGK